MTRPRPALPRERWLDPVDDEALFLRVISLSEILCGLTRLPESTRRTQLQTWLADTLRLWFEDRSLPVTQSIAEGLGRLAGERDSQGLTLPVPDGLMAATALEHNLTLVTRNVRDFAG
jgi:predicted nucleic acid-binding protein